jgi:hypothetical protein
MDKFPIKSLQYCFNFDYAICPHSDVQVTPASISVLIPVQRLVVESEVSGLAPIKKHTLVEILHYPQQFFVLILYLYISPFLLSIQAWDTC